MAGGEVSEGVRGRRPGQGWDGVSQQGLALLGGYCLLPEGGGRPGGLSVGGIRPHLDAHRRPLLAALEKTD